MKVTYTGAVKFSPAQQKKVDAKFAKLGKLLDRRGEKEAHLVLSTVRHLTRAEITVHYYDNALVGLVSDSDPLTAITGALDKIEKQIVKLREKRRDTQRVPEAKTWIEPVKAAPAKAAKGKPGKTPAKKAPLPDVEEEETRVYRVNGVGRKPMTLEEAMIEMDKRDYLVFLDADSDRVNVLVKRRDGHLDLIES